MKHNKDTFHNKLKRNMDIYVHKTYDQTKNFPKEELFGSVSQIRRASMSVILNYIEGYARTGQKTHKYFLEISYGSLKETQYLLDFSNKRGWIKKSAYEELSEISEEIGKMLWGTLRGLKNNKN